MSGGPRKFSGMNSINAIGGRNRFNKLRQEAAERRRAEVVRLLAEYGHGHGVQRRIAVELGVSETCISGDVKRIFSGPLGPAICRHCGSRLSRPQRALVEA